MRTRGWFAAGLVALSLVAAAFAVPAAAPATPTLTLDGAQVRAKWRESWLTGSVTFTGTVGAPAQLTAYVQGTHVVASKTITVPAGRFTRTIALPRRPPPGTYQLHIGGTSGGSTLPSLVKEVVVPAPREGIVDVTSGSASAYGPPAKAVSRPRYVIWARFHFWWPPQAKTVEVYWIDPSFRQVWRKVKPYEETVRTYAKSAGGLAKGSWFCYIKVNGVLAKRVSIRIK